MTCGLRIVELFRLRLARLLLLFLLHLPLLVEDLLGLAVADEQDDGGEDQDDRAPGAAVAKAEGVGARSSLKVLIVGNAVIIIIVVLGVGHAVTVIITILVISCSIVVIIVIILIGDAIIVMVIILKAVIVINLIRNTIVINVRFVVIILNAPAVPSLSSSSS